MSHASLEWGRTAGTGRKGRGFRGLVLDVPLLIILFAIASLGFVVLYSAVSADMGLLLRQGMRFALGLLAFIVVAQIPPQRLARLAVPLYCLGVALLVATMLFGVTKKGATRWLHAIGGALFAGLALRLAASARPGA